MGTRITLKGSPLKPPKIHGPKNPPVIQPPPPTLNPPPAPVGVPTSISVTPTSAKLLVGQRVQLVATVLDGTSTAISGTAPDGWHSSNTVVASVDATGFVVALAEGTANITATLSTASLTSNTVAITNTPPPNPTTNSPATIQVSVPTSALQAGHTEQLTAVVLDGAGNAVAGATPSWASSDTSILTVNGSGFATGVAAGGPALVTATYSTVSGTAPVTVTAPPPDLTPSTIAITPTTIALTTTGSGPLAVVVKNAAGAVVTTGFTIVWTSTNHAVATINSSGVVSGVGVGTTNIQATIVSPAVASNVCVVTVTDVIPSTIAVSPTSTTVNVGGTHQLAATVKNAEGVVLNVAVDAWHTSDGSKATVSASGLVTGAGAGSATITATITSPAVTSNSIAVTVQSQVDTTPASISISPTTASIAAGATQQMSNAVKNAANAVLSTTPSAWQSSSPSIATVNSSGLVTGVAPGTTNITATLTSPALTSNTAAVTVTQPIITGGTNLARCNFEDGTFGPFYNAWAGVGGVIDIIDDPTGGGHGKIARMQYSNNPPGQYDSNLGLYLSNDIPLTFGQSRWIQGDFYIPHPPAGTELQQRKLLVDYGQPSSGDGGLVTSWGQDGDPSHSQLNFAFGSGGAKAPLYTVYGLATFSWDAWHRLKVHYTIETSQGATNGAAVIYFDGAAVGTFTGLTWIAPGFTQIGGPGFGYQYNSVIQSTEFRYWDNLSMADAESAL